MMVRSLSLLLLLAVTLSSSANADELLRQHVARPLDAEGSMEALTPWETPIAGFFVRSHFDTPATDPEQWTLVIDGLVDHPLKLTVADLKAMEAKSLHAVLECSGNGRARQDPKVGGVQWERGAVGNAGWTGVPLKALLAKAGVKANGRYLTVSGADKPARPSVPAFVRSFPIAKGLEDSTLVAYQMDGEPMPLAHGGPLRLVLPNWYGENWTKWLIHIEVTAEEDHGFYMKKGYRMPKAAVKPGEKWDSATGIPIETLEVQTFIVSPVDGATVPHGALSVSGKTFSGAGPITQVDLSLDGGKHWSKAKVEAPHADGGWQAFTGELQVSKDGPVTIMSRATDQAGRTQPLAHTWNPGGYARTAADQVTVVVGASAVAPGALVLQEHCLTCHARAMIESQRLTEAQWQGEIDKMKTVFGANISPAEAAALLSYLTRFSPTQAPAKPEPVTYGAAVGQAFGEPPSEGNAAHGKELFAAQCAVCHGNDGLGDLGPRLKGRAMSANVFRLTVLHGRHTMPPFEGRLKGPDIDDLHAYLAR